MYQEKFDETVAKEKKTKNKKQEAENKEHINMDFKEEKSLFFWIYNFSVYRSANTFQANKI